MLLIKFKNIMITVNKINGWNCKTIDKGVFKAAINSLENISTDSLVKTTKNRTVFKLIHNKKLYYVKYSHPSSFSHKIKEFLFSKSYSEFKSAEKLKNAYVPVIKMTGYAKKLEKSLLISEDAGAGLCNARDFWLKKAKEESDLRKKFLNHLAEFIRKTINAKVLHPDYHLGNLLINQSNLNFMLMDPYGIKVSRKKLNTFKSGLVVLISFFKGDLTNAEFSDFCLKSGVINEIEEFKILLNSILVYQAKYLDRQWKNRRKRLLSKKSRFAVTLVDESGEKWHVRKTLTGEIVFNSNELKLDLLKQKYDVIDMDSESALKTWLFSFYLQFSTINHIKPLAMNIKKNILVLERVKYTTVKENELSFSEFIYRCKMSGINILNRDKDIAVFDNKLLLIECNPSFYKLTNKFY